MGLPHLHGALIEYFPESAVKMTLTGALAGTKSGGIIGLLNFDDALREKAESFQIPVLPSVFSVSDVFTDLIESSHEDLSQIFDEVNVSEFFDMLSCLQVLSK